MPRPKLQNGTTYGLINGQIKISINETRKKCRQTDILTECRDSFFNFQGKNAYMIIFYNVKRLKNVDLVLNEQKN